MDDVKAVILSAGQGKRLLPLTADRPKCLLPLAGRSILEWQVRALAQNGVDEVIVVTGFKSDAVAAAVAQMPDVGPKIRIIFNPFYTVTDNVSSCYLARDEMDGEFILMNGDTLMGPDVIEQALAGAAAPVNVTVDRKDGYDADDMKVCVEGDRLTRIGKTLPIEDVDAESIGCLVFRAGGGALFLTALVELMSQENGLANWYLRAVDMMAADGVVGTSSIEGLGWAEVDFPHDLEGAEVLAQRLNADLA
ncbi:MAG: phosphocholine cytidylyltransferase family protein [Pseudomonadota bacterium]